MRTPDCRHELKPSFFDWMAQAGVPLSALERRIDEVMALIPPETRNGRTDHVTRYFDVATGISGGAILASATISGLPLVELVREAVRFPVGYYFRPDLGEYWRGLKNAPLVPLKVLRTLLDDVRRGDRDRDGTQALRHGSRLLFELLTAFQDLLPRGLFTGEGISEYIEAMCARYGLANTFEEVRARGKHLFIIAERFNAVYHLSSPEDPMTAIYFGLPPYDRVPISHAIRASCSIPGITTPLPFVDHARGGRTYDLVDGAIVKTIGRGEVVKSLPIDCFLTINPIVPYDGPLNNLLDCMEQLYRKLIYSRLKAVESHLPQDLQDRTIHLESRPDDFFYNMLRLDKMPEGVFEGYYQTLKYCAENYVTVNDRLRRGGMCLIPRTEIFRLVTSSTTVRERAYIIRAQKLERGSLRKRLGGAIASALTGWDMAPEGERAEVEDQQVES